jgi:hypothetical protein
MRIPASALKLPNDAPVLAAFNDLDGGKAIKNLPSDIEAFHAAALSNHEGTDSRCWSQREIVAGQNRRVLPIRKWGTRLALTQRSIVSLLTLRMAARSTTDRAASELRSLSVIDCGCVGVSVGEAIQPRGTGLCSR